MGRHGRVPDAGAFPGGAPTADAPVGPPVPAGRSRRTGVAGLDAALVADRFHRRRRHRRRGGYRAHRLGVVGRPGRWPARGPSAACVTWPLFGLLMACEVGGVELTRRAGEKTGISRDMHAVWELPPRHPAAAGLRAPQPGHPDRPDAMAGPSRLAAPPGVQRGGARAQLPGRLVRLPRPRRHGQRAHPEPVPAWLRLDADRGGGRGGPARRQLGPGCHRRQGVRPRRPAPRRSVRARTAVQRHGRAVPGRAGLVRRREQLDRAGVLVPVRLAAAADRAARPAGERFAHRLQDRAAQRRSLAAGRRRRGGPGRARRAAAGRRRAGPGLVQADQRHLRAPVRR